MRELPKAEKKGTTLLQDTMVQHRLKFLAQLSVEH